MLQVKQQVDVVCSAISIKEAMIMCPITTWICKAIKDMIHHQECVIPIELAPEQTVAIGKILGELGFVNKRGENPLELIRELETKNSESDIAEQLEQSIAEQGIIEQCSECPE